MISATVEVAGFGCLVAAAFLLGGAPAALLVAGPSLLFLGASTDDSALGKNLRAVAAWPVRRVARLTAVGRARRDRRIVERLIGEASE